MLKMSHILLEYDMYYFIIYNYHEKITPAVIYKNYARQRYNFVQINLMSKFI